MECLTQVTYMLILQTHQAAQLEYEQFCEWMYCCNNLKTLNYIRQSLVSMTNMLRVAFFCLNAAEK